MTALTKAQLLAVITANSQAVLKDVDGVGELYFRKLTVSEQGELAKKSEKTDSITASIKLVALSLCDEDGKRMFDDNETDKLSQFTADQFTAIVGVINELNGFVKADDTKKN